MLCEHIAFVIFAQLCCRVLRGKIGPGWGFPAGLLERTAFLHIEWGVVAFALKMVSMELLQCLKECNDDGVSMIHLMV